MTAFDARHRPQRERFDANQMFGALLFLYRQVLGLAIDGIEDTARAERPVHAPLALSRAEVADVLRHLEGAPRG